MPKKQGLEAIRQATLHVHHAFCTFPCLRFTTLTSNLLTSRFMENVDTTERFSAVLFQIEIEIEPLTIQFQKNSPTFDKLNEVEFDRIAGSDEVCHSANSLFKKRFRCPRRHRCLIVVHKTLTVTVYLASSDCPVISCGIGRPITSNTVVATSQSAAL